MVAKESELTFVSRSRGMPVCVQEPQTGNDENVSVCSRACGKAFKEDSGRSFHGTREYLKSRKSLNF